MLSSGPWLAQRALSVCLSFRAMEHLQQPLPFWFMLLAGNRLDVCSGLLRIGTEILV